MSKLSCDQCKKSITKTNYIYCRTCRRLHCKPCFKGQVKPIIDQGKDTHICINCQLDLSKMDTWIDTDTDLIVYHDEEMRLLRAYHLQPDGMHGDLFMEWDRIDRDTENWSREQVKMLLSVACDYYEEGNDDARKGQWYPGSNEIREQGFKEEQVWELLNQYQGYHYYGFDPGNPEARAIHLYYDGETLIDETLDYKKWLELIRHYNKSDQLKSLEELYRGSGETFKSAMERWTKEEGVKSRDTGMTMTGADLIKVKVETGEPIPEIIEKTFQEMSGILVLSGDNKDEKPI